MLVYDSQSHSSFRLGENNAAANPRPLALQIQVIADIELRAKPGDLAFANHLNNIEAENFRRNSNLLTGEIWNNKNIRKYKFLTVAFQCTFCGDFQANNYQ